LKTILRDEEVLKALYDGSDAHVALTKCVNNFRERWLSSLCLQPDKTPDYDLTDEARDKILEARQREQKKMEEEKKQREGIEKK
jgi:hypothetical protein